MKVRVFVTCLFIYFSIFDSSSLSLSLHTDNKRSLVVDYNVLANEQQVIAFFLPEAPTEMLRIFDEVSP